VVRETVLAPVEAPVFPETGFCVCAEAKLAAARTRIAKDRFFTVFSISGGDKNYLILIIFVDVLPNEKNKKGWPFSNIRKTLTPEDRG
jgi:hypothetical protein